MRKSAANDVTTSHGGLTCERRHTTPGVHPFDEIEWEIRDAVIGVAAFEHTGGLVAAGTFHPEGFY